MSYGSLIHASSKSTGQAVASFTIIPWGWLFLILLSHPATAQYSVQDAFNLLTTSDNAGNCDLQKGAYFPLYYNVGCCGSPGFRVCPRVLHFNKGSYGISAGCTNPGNNQVNGPTCELPTSPPPIPAQVLPPDTPESGRNINFMVTSDLHFYRQDYNVMDQVSHPSAMVNWGISQLGKPPFPVYGAILIAGDMSMSAIDTDYYDQDIRMSGYRMMWENNWPTTEGYLPGASVGGTVVLPTLGNHEAATSDTKGAKRWWNYMSTLLRNQHVDRNHTGCLIGIDQACFDEDVNGGSLNYSFDWQGVHILMLNTWAGDTANLYRPVLGTNGLAWLQNDLAHYVGNTGKPVIIVQHYGLDSFSIPQWWTSDNVTAFEAVIKNYNIIGLFTGHSHALGMRSSTNTVNASSGNSTDSNLIGLGQTLDNFIDGSAGDCNQYGTDNNNMISGNPAGSTFCAHATKNFLSVHVDAKYMEVKTLSYSDLHTTPYLDNTINVSGESIHETATCKKRISGFFRIPTGYELNGDVSAYIGVHNTSGKIIKGPLALWVQDFPNTLTQWDFVDSCSSDHAHKFIVVTEGDLGVNATITIRLPTDNNFASTKGLTLVQLADSVTMSPASPVLGSAAPVTLTVSSAQGSNIPFTMAVDGPPYTYNVKWMHVSPSPDGGRLFTTPQTFTLSADNLSSYPQLFQNLTITDRSGSGSAPLSSVVLLANSVLNVPTNVEGAQATIANHLLDLPTVYTGAAAGGLVPLAVASPQYPSPGTRFTFEGWDNGGAATHTYILPAGGVRKTNEVKFTTAYQVTSTVTGNGTLALRPAIHDGYYDSGTVLSVVATPSTGYYFTGFTGGISGTNSHATGNVTAPLTFTAIFAKDPAVSVNTNISAAEGSYVSTDGAPHPTPYTANVQPNSSITFAAPTVFTSATNPGVRYTFQSWSDGDTNPVRGITVGTTDLSYSAKYQKQIQVSVTAVPAGSGTVSGSGWYNVGSNIALAAMASGGYRFTGFAGDLIAASSPQRAVAALPLNITATFAPADPAVLITASKIVDSDPATVQLTLQIANNGKGTVEGLTIVSATATALSGTGTPTVPVLPATPVTLAGGQSGLVVMPISWPASVTRVRLTLQVSGNSGTYTTSQVLTLFR